MIGNLPCCGLSIMTNNVLLFSKRCMLNGDYDDFEPALLRSFDDDLLLVPGCRAPHVVDSLPEMLTLYLPCSCSMAIS